MRGAFFAAVIHYHAIQCVMEDSMNYSGTFLKSYLIAMHAPCEAYIHVEVMLEILEQYLYIHVIFLYVYVGRRSCSPLQFITMNEPWSLVWRHIRHKPRVASRRGGAFFCRVIHFHKWEVMEIPNDVLIGTAGEENFYFIILCKYFPTVYTLARVQCPFLFTF